jgi:alkylation response protein AidB-like acyl-CoA dehydrogenase
MIDLLASAEQDQMADAVARVLADVHPIARLEHGRAPASLPQDGWLALGALGWLGLGLPEAAGGAGDDLTDAVLLHRLFGRQLMTPSLMATNTAAKLAWEQGDAGLASALVDGRAHAAFAILRAADRGAGECHLVDAGGASILLLLTADGARLLAPATVTDATPIAALDPTVPLARARLAAGALDRAAVPPAGHWARALIAAELSGVAAAAADMAVAYAKVRQQFGKPIGAFQAVAHACANCAVRAEAASVQSNFAALALRDGRPDAAFQVAAACLVGADAAFQNATANIQSHGGMGFAAESDAHLFLKRAALLRTLSGGDITHRRALLAEAPAVG